MTGVQTCALPISGIARPPRVPVEALPLADWNRMIGVNLTGCFLMAKHSVPHLRRTRGAIVNVASTRALQSEANTEPYSASKGGVVALSHALAVSLGPEIRVNCVSPGWIDTGAWQKGARRATTALRPEDHAQHPAGRVGTPEDVAAEGIGDLDAALDDLLVELGREELVRHLVELILVGAEELQHRQIGRAHV